MAVPGEITWGRRGLCGGGAVQPLLPYLGGAGNPRASCSPCLRWGAGEKAGGEALLPPKAISRVGPQRATSLAL